MPKGKHLRLEEVRDAARTEKEFTPRILAHALGVKPAAVHKWIDMMMERGMVKVMLEGGGPNPTVYEFDRPSADKSVRRRKEAPPEVVVAAQESARAKRARHNIRTRKVKTGNKRSQELVRAASKAGAEVRVKNNNHVEVVFKGQKETLALTPNQSSARGDKRKLRDMGIAA